MTLIAASPPPAGLDWAHPIVRDWFLERFLSPTEPQQLGWPHIVAGHTVLISAPTGSGKTLAAFLAAIDRLVRKALAGTLEDRTEVVYVSPLRALSNDIEKNLQSPLAEILALAERRGLAMPPVRTVVRTGDTLAPERRKMVERPPHILVTTPESLYVLLGSESGRKMLATTRSVEVWTMRPSSTGYMQETTILGSPSHPFVVTSTRHRRQPPHGSSASWWQSVGITIPARWAACRIVVFSGTSSVWPLIVKLITVLSFSRRRPYEAIPAEAISILIRSSAYSTGSGSGTRFGSGHTPAGHT